MCIPKHNKVRTSRCKTYAMRILDYALIMSKLNELDDNAEPIFTAVTIVSHCQCAKNIMNEDSPDTVMKCRDIVNGDMRMMMRILRNTVSGIILRIPKDNVLSCNDRRYVRVNV